MLHETMERIGSSGIIPVAVIEQAQNAVPLGNALLQGGMEAVEITFRTAAAEEAIRRTSAECPTLLVGAGTVINLEQCRTAVRAGAGFVVSPGFDEATVDYCLEHGIPVMPGCVTPSEIMRALAKGLDIIKFFPANIYGGLAAMKALAGPFGQVKFIPTGGVGPDNLASYLSSPIIYAVGGSWLCSKKDISGENFNHITKLCLEAREIAMKR